MKRLSRQLLCGLVAALVAAAAAAPPARSATHARRVPIPDETKPPRSATRRTRTAAHACYSMQARRSPTDDGYRFPQRHRCLSCHSRGGQGNEGSHRSHS